MTNNSKPTPAHHADIKALVDRYMEGATTNEEEAALRSWFRNADDSVPAEWRPIRAMLAFVDSERDALFTPTMQEKEDEAGASPHPSDTTNTSIRQDRPARLLRILRRPRLWIPSSVAAAAVALAMLVPRTGNGAEPQSYAVIDGKMYTNPEVVHEQAMDALNAVSADGEDPFSALDMMQ